jgi:hypothetical protein
VGEEEVGREAVAKVEEEIEGEWICKVRGK